MSTETATAVPETITELADALADATTVAEVAELHNRLRGTGLVPDDTLWTRCAARWDEISAGREHRPVRGTSAHMKPRWDR